MSLQVPLTSCAARGPSFKQGTSVATRPFFSVLRGWVRRSPVCGAHGNRLRPVNAEHRPSSHVGRYRVEGSPESADTDETEEQVAAPESTSIPHQNGTRPSAEQEGWQHRDVKASGSILRAQDVWVPPFEHKEDEAVTPVEPMASEASAPQVLEYTPQFQRSRLVTFAFMCLGYACFYLTRNSLTFVAPAMVQDAALGLDMTQIGGLVSLLPIAYGTSKFLSGVLGSRTSPSRLLAGGLMATAVANLAFGTGRSYLWLCVCWAANGVLQGTGAPACARMMRAWFPSAELGRSWAVWTASQNAGAFLAPMIVGTVVAAAGWRWGMFVPGLVGLVVGLGLLFVVKDDPPAAGLPSVDAIERSRLTATRGGAPSTDVSQSQGAAKAEKEKKPGMVEALVNECLKNPAVWLLAIAYFFVYVVRQGVTSWFLFYLLSEGGVKNGGAAALRVSGLELGGLLGSLSSGLISDWLVKRNNGGREGAVGLRVRVVMAYTLGTAAMLAAFRACPDVALLQWVAVAAVGFGLYGPQMLIGLCGAEAVSPAAVGACQGFLGWVAYLGAAGAGVPLAMIVQRLGWNAYFAALIGSCGVVLALMLPLLRYQSHSQRQALQAKAA